MKREPIWRVLHECAQSLTRAGRVPFTRGDLIECAKERIPGLSPNSANPIIQGMTGNLKGGAPGADGKNLLVGVGRGRFQLKRAQITSGLRVAPEYQTPEPAVTVPAEFPNTESALRDLLLATLIKNPKLGGLRMVPEGKLTYELPNGQTLDHASDILITDAKSGRIVSIELKYQSAVTDQFKCRAYDAMHMKSQYGDRLFTLMIFARNGRGIGFKRAEAICHPFDRFIGVVAQDLLDLVNLNALIECITQHVSPP